MRALTGDWSGAHYDTALALAEAEFIAVRVTHTDDYWCHNAFSFTRRPRYESHA